ncbi:MAG: hypothetical protein ACODAE_06745 [Gemmatimonadota bacterium]
MRAGRWRRLERRDGFARFDARLVQAIAESGVELSLGAGDGR